MTLLTRISTIFKARASAALDQMEDPQITIAYAYEQQQQLVRRVRAGLIDVTTSKKQIEYQASRIRQRIPELEEQARRALEMQRDDLARLALERRQSALQELEALEGQIAEVGTEESRLTATEQAVSARVEAFRTRRQLARARYTAAEARVRVDEAISGIGGEMAELGMALVRADEKTERMCARASAMDALIDLRADWLATYSQDNFEHGLRTATGDRAVEAELAALKSQMQSALRATELEPIYSPRQSAAVVNLQKRDGQHV